LEALHYGNSFDQAKLLALTFLDELVMYYLENMWTPEDRRTPGDGDGEYRELIAVEEYVDVRREVWELVRMCCIQEARLLGDAHDILQKEISRFG
jgi:hypothetical protein